MIAVVDRLNSALQEAGAFVQAGGLRPPSTVITVDATGGETKRIPGPFVEASEYVGEFWTIDVPDKDSGRTVFGRQDGEWVPQDEDLRVLVPIVARRQPQQGERVGGAQVCQ